MNCYIHNEKEAVGTCVGCGKFICRECVTEIKNKYYCKSCISQLIEENQKKIESLEESGKQQQPMVFMNAGGGSSSSSSSSSAASGYGPGGRMVPIKSRVAAALLAIFLGGLGVHKFYLGKPLMGILYLLFCWTGVPAIIGFIEGIIYLTKSNEAFAAQYGARYV